MRGENKPIERNPGGFVTQRWLELDEIYLFLINVS